MKMLNRVIQIKRAASDAVQHKLLEGELLYLSGKLFVGDGELTSPNKLLSSRVFISEQSILSQLDKQIQLKGFLTRAIGDTLYAPLSNAYLTKSTADDYYAGRRDTENKLNVLFNGTELKSSLLYLLLNGSSSEISQLLWSKIKGWETPVENKIKNVVTKKFVEDLGISSGSGGGSGKGFPTAGFASDSNTIYASAATGNSGIILCSSSSGTNSKYSVGPSGSVSGWFFKAKDKFGVRSDGLYLDTIKLNTVLASQLNCLPDDDGIAIRCGLIPSSNSVFSIGSSSKKFASVYLNKIVTTSISSPNISGSGDGSYIEVTGYLGPKSDYTFRIGYTGHRFAAMELKNMYLETFVGQLSNSGSDKRLKQGISSNYVGDDLLFDSLMPLSYVLKLDNKLHFGFIAQDVEALLSKADINNSGIVVKPSEENEYYSLSYNDFIAMNTAQIQKLKHKVFELEEQIKELKEEK